MSSFPISQQHQHQQHLTSASLKRRKRRRRTTSTRRVKLLFACFSVLLFLLLVRSRVFFLKVLVQRTSRCEFEFNSSMSDLGRKRNATRVLLRRILLRLKRKRRKRNATTRVLLRRILLLLFRRRSTRRLH